MNLYTFEMMIKFTPFYIVPYKQWIGYTRPDSIWSGELTEGDDIWLGGTYTLELCKLSTEYTQWGASVRKSFVDWIIDMNSYKMLPRKS